MMTEARAGFRAFNEGTRETGREVDFVALRRALAANTPWSDELGDSIHLVHQSSQSVQLGGHVSMTSSGNTRPSSVLLDTQSDTSVWRE